MYLVSACLAGINCRYNGGHTAMKEIVALVKEGQAIPICPEVIGGLPTPRPCAEMTEVGNVVNSEGEDVTPYFKKGAEKTLEIAKILGITEAILKSRSPSCGYGQVYDGSFAGQLKAGNGITAELLSKHGIKLYTEETFQR